MYPSLITWILVSLGFSILGGALYAWRWRNRLSIVVQGAQELANGNYNVHVDLGSPHGELGELARTFNALATRLKNAEKSHKQWVADTSHELRTPLAVLRAELEAIQDGVRQPDFDVLHNQVMALTKLTDELFQLARSDVGKLVTKTTPVDLTGLVRQIVEDFQSRYRKEGLQLELAGDAQLDVHGDADRLRQLIANVLENGMRYTEAPGKMVVTLAPDRVLFEDTPPGVAPEHREKIFERFFRVESSRSKKLGGSGLGLSICRAIAEAHGGTLTARESSLGGLCLELKL